MTLRMSRPSAAECEGFGDGLVDAGCHDLIHRLACLAGPTSPM